MSDLILPPWLRISAESPRFISSTAASESIFTGAVRTVTRTGDRIAYELSTANASEREAAPHKSLLEALAGEMRGQGNRVWYSPAGYRARGAATWTGELLANADFANGTTSWSTSTANIVLSASDRILRSRRSSVSGDETIRAASFTTINGATYIARVLSFAGRGPMDYRLRLGTTAGGNELAGDSSDVTTAGMRTLVAAATGTTTHFSIVDGTGSRAIGDFMEFGYMSVSRCALVNGASQTSSGLNIDQLPVSTSGLAKKGDLCQIGSQLCKIVGALDSDSSGLGFLRLAYPPRVTPADNAPVMFYQPMARFVAMQNEHGWNGMPGGLANFDGLSIVEDLSQ